MVKLYYPPAALLPLGNRDFVELAGAKCLLAMDEEKEFIIIADIFSELSWGEFWKEAAISDQIEKLQIKFEDSDAIYDSTVLVERIISAFNQIIDRNLILFGVASFEGNAFETVVFDEMEFNQEEADRLMNLYKTKRLRNAFPNIKLGQFVEINFFGEASPYFSLPNQKNLTEIASLVSNYEGNASGIVAVAQGAANFIILTQNISKKQDSIETRIDKRNLNQMFHLLKRGILAAPISWFKIDLGLKGLENLDNWDEIKNNTEIIEIKNKYNEYLEKIITSSKKRTIDTILANDLGNPINLSTMNDEEIFTDLDNIMDTLNQLNELETTNESLSLLYFPPNLLYSYSDRKKAAIGGAMALLSIDVGKNIYCVGDLRHNLSWGEYYQDIDSNENETFDGFQDQQYFELENAEQLRILYTNTLQKIMKNSQLFLGMLELESNAFEFSLFQELELKASILNKIQKYFREKGKSGNFPKLTDDHIKIKWVGQGSEYFINKDCLGILDLAEKIDADLAYRNKYAAGIVCVDNDSTHFYIFSNNFNLNNPSVNQATIDLMFQHIENLNIAPLCWFKITSGIESLKMHSFWKAASHYSSLLMVIDNYNKYLKELINIKKNEDKYRIY